MLLALTLWVSAALPVPEVPRPGSPLKDPAAQVLLSEKDVTIQPRSGKAAFKAAPGMVLERSDQVVVGPGAWVALAIVKNGLVVRLDDELSLLVSELALLDAPPQSQSIVQQLDAMVTRQEKERTARLIGWHASQTAANVQPVIPRESASEEKRVAAKDVARPEPSRDQPEARQEPAAERASAPKKKTQAKSLEAPPELPRPAPATPPAPPPAPPSAPAPRREAGGPPSPSGGAPPQRVDAQLALQGCLAETLSSWSPEVKSRLGASVEVSAKLLDGEIVVRLPYGLRPPACAAEWFKQQGTVGPTWTSVKVPLQ